MKAMRLIGKIRHKSRFRIRLSGEIPKRILPNDVEEQPDLLFRRRCQSRLDHRGARRTGHRWGFSHFYANGVQILVICVVAPHQEKDKTGGRDPKHQITSNPVMRLRSDKSWFSLRTLMVVIPMALAGFKLIPRSSR